MWWIADAHRSQHDQLPEAAEAPIGSAEHRPVVDRVQRLGRPRLRNAVVTSPRTQRREPNAFPDRGERRVDARRYPAAEDDVQTPQGQLSRLDVSLEQNGKSYPIFALNQPTDATTRQEAADRLFISRPIGKRAIPELQPGPARIVVHAARPVLRGMRQIAVEATRDVQVRLEPPQASVVSTFHYVNLGGAEFIVYRATPADVESGVRVGDRIYPGFPGTAVGIKSDPAIHVAFFALAYDQDVNTPITVFAVTVDPTAT